MSNPSGIRTQSAASVLEDVNTFYFGGVIPWYHGTKLNDDGTKIIVILDDPDQDEGVTKKYELTATQIKDAYAQAKAKGYQLCCKDDIESEQLGYGCVQDLDLILQTACYGEAVFG